MSALGNIHEALSVETYTAAEEHHRNIALRLLGALDAADKKLVDRMNTLRDTADGFLQAVIDRHPAQDPELANRYDAYARQARAALIAFRAAVNDALEADK